MIRQRALWGILAIVVIGTTALAVRAVDEHEEEVTLDQVPAAVKAAILKEAAGAAITEVERVTKDGRVFFEAEFVREGREVEVQVAEDGTILGREAENEGDDEDDLTIDQVPEPARTALRELARGATIVSAETEMEHGVRVYEAEWTRNGTRHEAAVTADGTLIETEEIVPLEKLPPAVRDAVARHFGPGTTLVVEKKMVVVYEIEGKVNGRSKEILVYPTGRVNEAAGDDDADDDDDGEAEDDD